MQTIAVIDYGMGNLRSVVNALELVSDKSQKVLLTSDPEQISNADRIVFPGQGAAGDCMRAINQHELIDTIKSSASDKPFLGICMGLQVLVNHSEENQGTDCLGVIPGQVRYFGDHYQDSNGQKLKVPHMGWNRVKQSRQHPLWASIDDNSRFYFVHSFFVETESDSIVSGICDYGRQFTCAIAKDNLFAIQCHPEKSADAGLQLLRNFVNWDGQS